MIRIDRISGFISQVYKGKTLRRIVFGWKLEDWCPDFSGRVIDFGAGNTEQYQRLVRPGVEIIATDIHERTGVVCVDLNTIIPFESNSVDVATLFFVLYIVEDQSATLREMYRILKPGGTLYIATPLIAPEIPEPHDYYRHTYEGLERLFRQAGFSQITIERSGGRATSAVVLLHPFFLFNTVRLFIFAIALFIDRLAQKRDVLYPCPHTYFCKLTK